MKIHLLFGFIKRPEGMSPSTQFLWNQIKIEYLSVQQANTLTSRTVYQLVCLLFCGFWVHSLINVLNQRHCKFGHIWETKQLFVTINVCLYLLGWIFLYFQNLFFYWQLFPSAEKRIILLVNCNLWSVFVHLFIYIFFFNFLAGADNLLLTSSQRCVS